MSANWRVGSRGAGALLGAIGLAAAVGGPAAAPAQDARQLLPWLELPATWSRAVEGGVVAAMPGDLPAGASLLLLIEPPQAPAGSLGAAYDSALGDLGPWTPIGDPVEAQLPSGWWFRQGMGVVQLEGTAYTAMTAIARHDSAQARFWVLADSAVTFDRYQADVGNAIGSVQGLTLAPSPPGSGGAPQSAAAAVTRSTVDPGFGQGLSGVYVGVERGLSAGAGAGGQELNLDLSTNEMSVGASAGSPQTRLTIADYEEVDVFYPDGTYRRRLPIRGLAADQRWERGQQPVLWGTWSRAGNQVTARRGSYATTYTVQGADLVSDRGRVWTKLPMVSNARLEGSYARADYRDASAPRIVLTPDGRYEDRGGFLRMVGSSWHLVVPDGDTLLGGWSQEQVDRAMAPGGGTYTFEGFTLTLNDRDGRVWQINAYVPPGESLPRPGRLVINGRALVRD